MHTQVIERSGVMLQVEFVPPVSADEVISFNSIRVLDGDYRPCGPNLVQLLDPLLVLSPEHEGAQPGDTGVVAERLLSTLIDEVSS